VNEVVTDHVVFVFHLLLGVVLVALDVADLGLNTGVKCYKLVLKTLNYLNIIYIPIFTYIYV
jgi:hypothetical protein